MAAPRMPASWIEVVISSHFADFKQVKNLIVILLTLGKSKNQPYSKIPLEETGCLSIFGLPPVTGTPPWLLRLKVSTSSELYPDTLGSLFFCFFVSLNEQAFSFLICTHVTYGMPCHTRGHHSLTQGSRGFPWGDNHSKHVPLPTCLT